MLDYGRDHHDTDAWIDSDGTVHVGHHDDATAGSEQPVPGRPAPITVRLSDVAPELVSWLWQGRLPAGKLVTLDGDPGTGKSTLAVEITAHVTTGTPWPDGTPCPRGDVVILSAEDGMADTIRPRLDAAGGDPSRVHCLTAVDIGVTDDDGRTITRPPTLADTDAIRAAIESAGALLLIVDVLMAYLPSRVDSHRDQDVRVVLHRIAEIADQTGATVLLLRHLNKAGAGSPLYRGGGSIGIVGAARAGYVVAPDPDDDDSDTIRVLAAIKSNLAPLPPSLRYRLTEDPDTGVTRVAWHGESSHAAAALLTPESGEERTERDDAAAFILDYLTRQGGCALAREVQAAGRKLGYSKTTMHNAAKRVRVRKSKDGMQGPWYWRHPDDAAEGSPEGSEDSGTREAEPSEPSRNLRAVPPPDKT